MKVRYFGFLSPSFSMPIKVLKGRIELAQGFTVAAAPTPTGIRIKSGIWSLWMAGVMPMSRVCMRGFSTTRSASRFGWTRDCVTKNRVKRCMPD